jgi:hypothetical protein
LSKGFDISWSGAFCLSYNRHELTFTTTHI